MATPRVTIPELPPVDALDDADLIVVQNGETTKRMPIGSINVPHRTALADHINDVSDAHQASAIGASPNVAPMDGTNVQLQLGQAAAELVTSIATTAGLAAHLADTTDAHDASAVSVTPLQYRTGTNVQAVLAEISDLVGDGEMIEVGPTPPPDTEWLWADTNAVGDEGGTNGVINVLDVGAHGDGATDDTVSIQLAFDAVNDGGTVLFPSGRTFLTQGNTLARSVPTAAISVDARGARIKAMSAAPLLTFNSTHNVDQIGPIVLGGIWDGSTTAVSAFKFTDCGTTRFRDINVLDCTGPAFHLRNEDSFSENMSFTGVRVLRCGGIARYDGAAATGGTGAESFARQHWSDVFGGQLTANWFQFEGNVYDSRFEHIKGNLSGATPIAIFASTGGGSRMLNGTHVDQITVEGGGAGSSMIDMPNITNYRMSFGPDYVLRNSMTLFAAGTDHDNVIVLDGRGGSLWIPAQRFVASAGTPTLTMVPWPHWALAAGESLSCVEELPRDWTYYYCDAVWFNAGAGVGNCNIRFRKNEVAEGGTIAAPATGEQQNVLAAAGLNVLTTSRIKNSVTVTYPSMTAFMVSRFSTSDTLPNDIGFVGMKMYRREADT